MRISIEEICYQPTRRASSEARIVNRKTTSQSVQRKYPDPFLPAPCNMKKLAAGTPHHPCKATRKQDIY